MVTYNILWGGGHGHILLLDVIAITFFIKGITGSINLRALRWLKGLSNGGKHLCVWVWALIHIPGCPNSPLELPLVLAYDPKTGYYYQYEVC